MVSVPRSARGPAVLRTKNPGSIMVIKVGISHVDVLLVILVSLLKALYITLYAEMWAV